MLNDLVPSLERQQRRSRLFWLSIAEFFGDAVLHCFILIAPVEVSGLRLMPALGRQAALQQRAFRSSGAVLCSWPSQLDRGSDGEYVALRILKERELETENR